MGNARSKKTREANLGGKNFIYSWQMAQRQTCVKIAVFDTFIF
jgi:hypothetical protein